MPNIERAFMEYVVSFNTSVDGEEMGESGRESEDYQGDNLEELIAEVIAADPKYPMVYEANTSGDGRAVGFFYSDDVDHYVTAVIVRLVDW